MAVRLWSLLLLAAGASLSIPAAPIKADVTQAFAIEADTSVDSRDPTFNFGVDTSTKVVVNGNDGSLRRALFKVPDQVWATPGGDLVSAKVWFYVWSDKTGERTISLHPLTQAFAEGTGDETESGDGATWQTYDGSNTWTTAGGDYDASVFVEAVAESSSWFSWDITALWNNTDLRSFGAMLRMDDESFPADGSMPRAPFTSSDGPANEQPYIEVTIVPEPATAIMLLCGAVATLRRRKQ